MLCFFSKQKLSKASPEKPVQKQSAPPATPSRSRQSQQEWRRALAPWPISYVGDARRRGGASVSREAAGRLLATLGSSVARLWPPPPVLVILSSCLARPVLPAGFLLFPPHSLPAEATQGRTGSQRTPRPPQVAAGADDVTATLDAFGGGL